MFKFLKLKRAIIFGAVFSGILLSGFAACAADSVGLVNSQKIMFQHPRFDETTKFLLFLSRPLESSAAQILIGEQDPERRQMVMRFSTQVTEFAEMDRAILAEKDERKKDELWENRQKRFTEFQESLMNPILAECGQATQAVMELKQMTVVIELDSVYYGGTDITEEVIEQVKSTAR